MTPISIWSGKGGKDDPVSASTKNRSHQSHNQKIFIMPNPVLWLLGIGSIAIFFLGCFISKARSLEGSNERNQFFHLDSHAGHALTFWALQTFFFLLTPDHSLTGYLPALYASIMLSSQLLEGHHLIAMSVACAIAASFYTFLPLTYGLAIDPEFCERLQLFDHWKFDCSV